MPTIKLRKKPFVDWYAATFRLGWSGALSEEKSAQVLERLLKEYPELYDEDL